MRRLEMMDNNNNYNSQVSTYSDDDGLGGNLSLLKTIKLPKNLKLLTDRLPKSNYGEANDHSRSSIIHLAETSSVKSIRTNPDDNHLAIRTGGKKAQIAIEGP